MNADQVRAYVAAKWPQAMQSPVALACAGFAVADEADRAIEFAQLQAKATDAEAAQMRADAMEHARLCIEACDAAGIEYDAETLGHNIESAFDLDPDECDEIAAKAIAAQRGY